MPLDHSRFTTRATVVAYRLTPIVQALPGDFEATCTALGLPPGTGLVQFVEYVLHQYDHRMVEGFDIFACRPAIRYFEYQGDAVSALWKLLRYPGVPEPIHRVIVRVVGSTLWVSYLDSHWK